MRAFERAPANPPTPMCAKTNENAVVDPEKFARLKERGGDTIAPAMIKPRFSTGGPVGSGPRARRRC